ncbi:MAG: hypothetical protein KF878_33235, partial [Planctomycetes bacterium]|nr:hypothetical protein [Planctomycetota bacterium]
MSEDDAPGRVDDGLGPPPRPGAPGAPLDRGAGTTPAATLDEATRTTSSLSSIASAASQAIARAIARAIATAAAPGGVLVALGLALLAAWRLAEPAADLGPLGRSLEVALVAAAVAWALGVAGGWLHAHRLPAGPALLCLAIAPLVVPPFLVALGWLDLVGPGGRALRVLGVRPPAGPALLAASPLYTAWACGALLGAALHPIPLLAARAALLRLDPACLEAARLVGGARAARRIALATAAPAAGAGAALVFALALLERATPLLVLRGVPVPVQVEEVALRFAAERDAWLA